MTSSDLLALLPPLAGRRFVLGIVGPPGAGKSVLAAQLHDAVARSVVVPMDGFHLSNAELARLGRADRKGAPDTFDAAGYAALLTRIRQGDESVYAPAFDRSLEESIGGSICVEPGPRLVITEGNYLLLPTPPWDRVRAQLDACWYVDVDDAERVQQLVDRHVSFGKSPEVAHDWVMRSDEANATLVISTRDRADRVIRRLRTA